MLFSSTYSSKLLSVKVMVMDTQETHVLRREKREETKKSRKQNNKISLSFISVLRKDTEIVRGVENAK